MPLPRPNPNVTPDPAPEARPTAEALAALITDLLRTNTPDLLNHIIGVAVKTAFEGHARNQVHTAQALGISRNVLRTHLVHLGYIAPRRNATKV